MIMVDTRMNNKELEELESMKGKRFIKYKSDPMDYSGTVYGTIGLYIGDDIYRIDNFEETKDFFGEEEGLSVLHVTKCKEKDISSALDDVSQIDFTVDDMIIGVSVIEDTVQLYKNGTLEDQYNFTKAIVFKLFDREIAYVRQIWMSEEIEIVKGTDVIDRIPTSDNEISVDKEYKLKVERVVRDV